jgi:hypothetical protein
LSPPAGRRKTGPPLVEGNAVDRSHGHPGVDVGVAMTSFHGASFDQRGAGLPATCGGRPAYIYTISRAVRCISRSWARIMGYS